MRKIDQIKLHEEIENKNILVRSHPTYPLRILNYSKQAEYGRIWNEITMQCRGLIVNDQYEIVAQPFEKFFNKGQLDIQYPTDLSYEIFEKMDGWYGIIFFYDNKWNIATRGSFDSDQAIRSQAILDKIDMTGFIVSRTYLVEIINPETRIVVKYDDLDKFFVLGAIEYETNVEIPYDQLKVELANANDYFVMVKKYEDISIEAMAKENVANREGYVIRFSNGFRMKIKFDEYCDIHAASTDLNNKHVWRLLRDGKKVSEIAEIVPDEYHDWLKEHARRLNEKFINFENDLYKAYTRYTMSLPPKYTMKDFALGLYADKSYKKIMDYILAIHNNTNYDRRIWNEIEPEYERTNLAKFKEEQNARRLRKDY